MLPVSVLIRGRPAPYLLDASFTVAKAATFLEDHHIGGAPVLQDDELVGFASERDIVFRVVAAGRDHLTTTVADIMSKKITSATAEDTVEDCEQMMRRAHVRHLPILEKGKVVACLSLRDLLQSELRQAEVEVRSLTEYVRGTGAG